MEKRNLLIYRIVTGLFSLLVLIGVSQYFFNHEMVKEMFTNLHFPTYLIYPMGIAKLIGVIVIWFSKSNRLKEWAYAAFVLNLLLAISAHLNVHDNEYFASSIVLILILASYFFYRKLETK
ncbi:DoxX family protein [Aureivirga marina]|uniref:DoxX family protein n=1 Tax=Aureivirga marina TaxID=1182451 RepID=UPI0018CA88E6|nr:DoxX family protein [Aureivirga marina]